MVHELEMLILDTLGKVLIDYLRVSPQNILHNFKVP